MTDMQDEFSVLKPGQLIGGCQIVRLEGRGGMGEVYLAEHLSLERPVAVKTLRPDLKSRDPVERFLKEARMCARIEHPNVVTIHDVGQSEGLYYIVMQFVQGKNLSELVREYNGPLPWRSAIRLIQLAAGGLQAVHDHNLVHRDVKPSNIMLATDFRVLLMDFGLVGEMADASVASATGPMGTPPFMSPEQCAAKPLDRRSDIFSLGSTFYCLLTGRPPFVGQSLEVMNNIANGKQPEPIGLINPDVPTEVSDVILRAMAPDREDRFPTAGAIAAELRKVLKRATAPPERPPDTIPSTIPYQETRPVDELPPVELLPLGTKNEKQRTRAGWFVAGAIALVVVVLVAVASLLSNGQTPQPPPGMVYIEPGWVQLGNDRQKVTAFLQSYLSEANLEKVLAAIAREPRQRVEVPGFCIDAYEVTNAQYAKFISETGRTPPEHFDGANPPAGKADHPVVNIRYEDAESYTGWAGRKLPTRQQWLRAFRADNDWLFPWGDDYAAGRANVGDNPKYKSTSPVDDTPDDVSPFKVYNMVGNASEFIRGTFTHEDVEYRVAKGAEYKLWGFAYGIGSHQYLYRPLDFKEKGVGFRCVLEMP